MEGAERAAPCVKMWDDQKNRTDEVFAPLRAVTRRLPHSQWDDECARLYTDKTLHVQYVGLSGWSTCKQSFVKDIQRGQTELPVIQLSVIHSQGHSSHPLSSCVVFYSRSSLNAKLDETVPLKCDDPYITPSMVSLSAPVVTSSDGHSSTAAAAYSQSNIVRVSAL